MRTVTLLKKKKQPKMKRSSLQLHCLALVASSTSAFTTLPLNQHATSTHQMLLHMAVATNASSEVRFFSTDDENNRKTTADTYSIPAPKRELWKVERVDRVFEDDDTERPMYPNPLSLKPNTPLSWFVDEDDAVAAKVNVALSDMDLNQGIKSEAFTLAGPRFDIAFDPKQCRAAVVTCGGLCPGKR